MPNVFFIADLHLNHRNILTFKDKDDNLIRPDFKDVDEMNSKMIDAWNSVVNPGEKIYVCGDFSFDKDAGKYISRLNGKKRLILGNHDDVKGQELYKFFEKIYAWRVFREWNFVATHMPLHPSSMFKVKNNVHGHTHQNFVMQENGKIRDYRYFNVSVEPLNYKPISGEEISEWFKKHAG